MTSNANLILLRLPERDAYKEMGSASKGRLRQICSLGAVALGLLSCFAKAQEDEGFKPECALPFKGIAVRHSIDDTCGREGNSPSAAIHAQDPVKNNFCAAGSPVPLTIDDFVALENLSTDIPRPLRSGDRSGLVQLLQLPSGRKIGEGAIVRVIGFVIRARYTAAETVNCRIPGPENNDVHFLLGRSPSDDPCTGISAEISPHFRPDAWNVVNLTSFPDHPVRVIGQLFFDSTHHPCHGPGQPTGHEPQRASVWEVHPVYGIDVCSETSLEACTLEDENAWVRLDQWVQADARPETRGVGTSLVQIKIDSAYDDSERSLRTLRDLLPRLPARSITVDSSNVPELVQKYFGFSSEQLPRTYQLLKSELYRRNHWMEDDRPELPGSVLLPLLPMWTRPAARRATATANIADWDQLNSDGQRAKGQAAVVAVSGEARAVQENKELSAGVLQEIHVPEKLLPAYRRRYSAGGVFDRTISVRLASAPPAQPSGQPHALLTAEEKNLIQGILQDSNGKEVVLLVADTGWPDKRTFEQSREDLFKIFDTVRLKYKLGAADPRVAVPWREPSNAHCKQIQQSLAELQALDLNHRIKIIFVPLLPEQGARSVIRELLEINYYRSALGRDLGDVEVEELGPSTHQKAHDESERIVSKLQSSWTSDEVVTDQSIVTAYLELLTMYAGVTNRASFLSESWILPHQALEITYPDPFPGVVIAAAGNVGRDFVKEKLDFAERSMRHRDTLAVINMDRNGRLQCGSSTLTDRLDTAMAVGFDGRLSGGICGTSFAAPRIAWLLAATETLDEKFEDSTWEDSLYRRIVQGRNSGGDLGMLWFNISRFVTKP